MFDLFGRKRQETCLDRYTHKTQVNVRVPTALLNEADEKGISITDAAVSGLRARLQYYSPQQALELARAHAAELQKNAASDEETQKRFALVLWLITRAQENTGVTKQELSERWRTE
jgi:hypothetical protein